MASLDHKPAWTRNFVRLKTSVVLAIGLFAAALVGIAISKFSFSGLPALSAGTFFPTARPIADFNLKFENGAEFTRKDLTGHWTALFAGYTHCPDVCPTALAQLKAAKAKLGADAEKLTILFLSVDPERDTPDRLADYVHYFDPSFRAATGSEQQINAFAANLFIVHMKAPNESSGGYEVGHSAELILIDPKGRHAGFLRSPFVPETLAADLKAVLMSRVP
ncbi:SCO family protein [Candidatus Methylospira mobilis]|uniref:SCO family protein n=1 Tax=Candidatus Methylospira mobilis TaxID=1808979 RepID=UPI0028E624EF|nr:SCO family protein [Candidatus Methylospira mobilis]WNV03411.1 SCO family protein [Candidatus Methylospira mobilis]